MAYVDGFVIPLPKDKVAEYRQIAARAGEVWKEHGALEYRECLGDDLAPHGMQPFGRAVDATADETVIFAWITFRSREHRDEVNAKVMADPRLADSMAPEAMPFDASRMLYGGFSVLVDTFNAEHEAGAATPTVEVNG